MTTLKRKAEFDDVSPVSTKQLKLVPFPHIELDTDVAMSEAEPLYPNTHHSRLHSGASSISSSASDSPISDISYPYFDLYPFTLFPNTDLNLDSDNSTSSPNFLVGLRQPSSPFIHHGANCTQIPKLKVACASGVNGQRTMWSHCEQCGAISVVECD